MPNGRLREVEMKAGECALIYRVAPRLLKVRGKRAARRVFFGMCDSRAPVRRYAIRLAWE